MWLDLSQKDDLMLKHGISLSEPLSPPEPVAGFLDTLKFLKTLFLFGVLSDVQKKRTRFYVLYPDSSNINILLHLFCQVLPPQLCLCNPHLSIQHTQTFAVLFFEYILPTYVVPYPQVLGNF